MNRSDAARQQAEAEQEFARELADTLDWADRSELATLALEFVAASKRWAEGESQTASGRRDAAKKLWDGIIHGSVDWLVHGAFWQWFCGEYLASAMDARRAGYWWADESARAAAKSALEALDD